MLNPLPNWRISFGSSGAGLKAHPRNKSDAVLRALADKGGVIGIYELSFLSRGPAQQSLAEYLALVKPTPKSQRVVRRALHLSRSRTDTRLSSMLTM